MCQAGTMNSKIGTVPAKTIVTNRIQWRNAADVFRNAAVMTSPPNKMKDDLIVQSNRNVIADFLFWLS